MKNLKRKLFDFSPQASRRGFSLSEILVVVIILMFLLTLIFANFRGNRFSGELDIGLKQVINAITTARNLSLGGQLTNGSLPAGGYGVYFSKAAGSNSQLILFQSPTAGGDYISGNELSGSPVKLTNVEVLSLCGLATDGISALPCGTGWIPITGNTLAVIFSLPDQIYYKPEGGSYKYVGGVLKHAKTGKTAYFYVSLVSGLVAGDPL